MKALFILLLLLSSIPMSRQEKPAASNDEFVFVEGNAFIQSFYISKYEVTIAEFMAFQKATGYKTVAERLDSGIVYNPRYKMVKGVTMRHDLYGDPLPEDLYEVTPASRIVLEDAQAYAKWKGGRIPTNEEWAYAAKGGKKSKGYRYPGGNNPNRIGYFDRYMKPGYQHPQPVGQKEPNELGIYDLGGNVQEITYNPKEEKLVRRLGGSYFGDGDYSLLFDIHKGVFSQVEYANSHPSPFDGFRIVKDAR